jgi:hypothetical protein
MLEYTLWNYLNGKKVRRAAQIPAMMLKISLAVARLNDPSAATMNEHAMLPTPST